MQPNYIYAIGNGICKTRINSPDTEESLILKHLQCFEGDVGHVRALGFHAYAELLFYSDVDKGTIHRKRMTEADEDSEVIVVQTGLVTGKRKVLFKGDVLFASALLLLTNRRNKKYARRNCSCVCFSYNMLNYVDSRMFICNSKPDVQIR